MTIKVQTGIPLPPRLRGKKSLTQTLQDMKPMQSFKVPKKYYYTVYNYAKRCGVKITGRWNGTGVRIWKLS